MLVDSHCHLDFKEFSEDFDAMMWRANQSGVGMMVTICTRISNFETVLSLAEAHDNLYCTVGVHPHEADEEGDVSVQELVALASHPKVIGIGETGLDYHYMRSDKAAQIEAFEKHIAAARATQLPLIVHARNADEDMISILKNEYEKGPFPGVIHCFSSTADLAWAAIGIGFYISFSGIVTFKAAEEVQDVARAVPLNRVLVETDAPYLAPVPNRGKTNEPAFVRHTAEKVADLKEVSFEEIEEATTNNFFDLFSKTTRPEFV